MPQISVIVPVYKVEKYIHRCVDSILGQTHADFELILVDDGSPDNCPSICDEYAAEDSRVVVIHQENGGLSAARNAGIDWVLAHSDSQWLTFVDSDDWIHPEMLQRLLDVASVENTRVSVCGYMEAAEEAVPEQSQTAPRICSPEDFYCENHVNAVVAWGKLYHRSCFETIRYPVGKLHEDEFVTYQILFNEEWIAVIPDSLYYYFVNTAGISKSRWTPARLHGLEAMEMQLAWLRERGFGKACQACIHAYIGSIVLHLQTIEDSDLSASQRIGHLRTLRKKLRSALVRYGKWYPVAQHCWIYELAFPWGMKAYWIATSMGRKLKRIFVRN